MYGRISGGRIPVVLLLLVEALSNIHRKDCEDREKVAEADKFGSNQRDPAC